LFLSPGRRQDAEDISQIESDIVFKRLVTYNRTKNIAEENVAMPKFLSTKDFNKSVLDSRKLLKALDLDDRRSHYPNQLSGGEQQRVAVARSLINSPEIIFADEPTGNLDSKHSDELIDLLINLNKKHGQTFVIATHNKDIANKMDRCFNLKDGILSEIRQ